MHADKPVESNLPTPPADQTTGSADAAMAATQRIVHSTLDGLAGSAHALNQQVVTPLLERAGDQAAALTQRTLDSVRDGSRRVQEQALRTSERTLDYIRAEPVKAVLMATALGAALMALGQRLLGHARRHD